MQENYQKNVEVFNETRELSNGEFLPYTKEMQSKTEVYCDPLLLKPEGKGIYTHYIREKLDTVSAAIKEANEGYKPCVLNFADGITPGGCVALGEKTQEESICRCSNLYESLILPECIEKYYEANKKVPMFKCTDSAIYSRDVLFFRENKTYTILENKFRGDVITCPAPHRHYFDDDVYEEIATNRIRGIVNVAALNDCDSFIIGAWGCGAFGGDIWVVAKAFAKALKDTSYFKRVVIAIPVRKDDTDTFDDFVEAFRNSMGF